MFVFYNKKQDSKSNAAVLSGRETTQSSAQDFNPPPKI
jgi:hypothetical protein